MDVTSTPSEPNDCQGVNEVLSRVGDKWTVQVVVMLRGRAYRFNDLKRGVAGISQQMLTRTLKSLERDGLVLRTVTPTTPPQVEYALTDLGRSLSERVRPLAEWARENLDTIHDHRQAYDG